MGTILNAYCEECGFENEVWYGAGMADYGTVCNVPAIDNKSGKFVIRNILAEDKLKDDLSFYNDPVMFNGKIKNEELQWGEIYLKADKNLCPKCKSFTMQFIQTGNFD